MPEVPESVALAQPILYLFIISLCVIVGGFLGMIKWMMGRFLDALETITSEIGDDIMDKLDTMDAKLDNVSSRRRRGLTGD